MTQKKVFMYMTYATIDTACAVYLYLRDLFPGVSPVESVESLNVVLSMDAAGKIADCLEVDAIPGNRYKDRKIPSATEAYAIDAKLGVVSSDGRTLVESDIPGLVELCEMLGANNSFGHQRGGYLKDRARFPFPFAWFLREAGDIPVDGLDTLEERVQYWLRRTMRAIDTYFVFFRKVKEEGITADVEGFRDNFPELADDLSVGEGTLSQPEGLLTVPGYLLARFSTLELEEWKDGGAEKLEAECRFWRDAFTEGKEVEVRAEIESEEYLDALKANDYDATKDSYFFATPAGPGAFIQTGNQHVAKYMWKRSGLPEKVVFLLIRTSAGSYKLLTRIGVPVDVKAVYEELEEDEPGQWHYETRFDMPMILNGSGKVIDVTPSKIEPAEFIGILRRQVKVTNIMQRNDRSRFAPSRR